MRKLNLSTQSPVQPQALPSEHENRLHVQISHLVSRIRNAVKKLDHGQPSDELKTVQLRSKKHEIIVAPEYSSGHDYILVVVQSPVID